MDETHLVFVYGTLRRGASRDAMRFYPGARFVGAGRVRGRLHDLGDYPGLRLDHAGGWVIGDLVEVDARALRGMDEWEGIQPGAPVDGEYRRIPVDVTRPDGSLARAWVYEAAAATCAGRPEIAGGDWLTGRER